MRRLQRILVLGGGSIRGGPCDAIWSAKDDLILTLAMANGQIVPGLRLQKGMIYPFEALFVLASNKALASTELWALFEG